MKTFSFRARPSRWKFATLARGSFDTNWNLLTEARGRILRLWFWLTHHTDCAWCKRRLRSAWLVSASSLRITHTICPACEEKCRHDTEIFAANNPAPIFSDRQASTRTVDCNTTGGPAATPVAEKL